MARKKNEGGGAPEWLVTFGDLMSLLVCFFVLIISFSVQDQEKVQVVSGSIQDAFGISPNSRQLGLVEVPGLPTRKYRKFVAEVPKLQDSSVDGTIEKNRMLVVEKAKTGIPDGPDQAEDHKKSNTMMAAATLRQSWQELPDVAEMSDNILVESTPEGLNVQLIDQEGRAMFPAGSKIPYERTRYLLSRMVPTLKGLANRIIITGHTTSNKIGGVAEYSNWELSSDRANEVRRILMENGLPESQIKSVQGKADGEPLFPNNPSFMANSRISILIVQENPAAPSDLTP